jgi:magnesium and cobalt transporter
MSSDTDRPSNPNSSWWKSVIKKFRQPLPSQPEKPSVVPVWPHAVIGPSVTLLAHLQAVQNLTAKDIMIPRVDIAALDEAAELPEILAVLRDTPQTCLPVYRGSLDDIVGAVNTKDLFVNLAAHVVDNEPFNLSAMACDMLFVSPSMRLFDLLEKMQQHRLNIALVVDEYGGVDGLVSQKDILQQLLSGFDEDLVADLSQQLIQRADGSFLADARIKLEELETKIGDFLSEEEQNEDFDTLGGLVSFLIGRVPNRGEVVRHASGVEFEIVDADPRRVKRVIIRAVEPLSASLADIS